MLKKKIGHRIFIFKPNGKGRKHLLIGVSAAIPVEFGWYYCLGYSSRHRSCFALFYSTTQGFACVLTHKYQLNPIFYMTQSPWALEDIRICPWREDRILPCWCQDWSSHWHQQGRVRPSLHKTLLDYCEPGLTCERLCSSGIWKLIGITFKIVVFLRGFLRFAVPAEWFSLLLISGRWLCVRSDQIPGRHCIGWDWK